MPPRVAAGATPEVERGKYRMATIIDGKAVAAQVRQEAAARAAALASMGAPCGLAVVLVGQDAASAVYVRNKRRDCAQCGIRSYDYDLPATTTQSELDDLLARLNADDQVSGILVQMPLPSHLDPERAVAQISPEKDVDGFHPVNLGRLMRGLPGPRPCTPAGVMRLLRAYGIDPAGRRAVVLGRSTIVGKPMALMLMEADATVTICHSRTPNKVETSHEADIVVSAIGRPRLVKADWMRPGATVIDVGMNRDEQGRLCGDVDFEEVEPVCGAITPVPGGVGPMTRAMLMLNTVTAAERLAGIGSEWPR